MTHVQGEPDNRLRRAEQLLNVGKYDEALQVLESPEDTGKLDTKKQLATILLKCRILIRKGAYEEGLRLAQLACDKCRGQSPSLQAVDAYLALANVLDYLGEFDESLSAAAQAEHLLSVLQGESSEALAQRKASLLDQKGVNSWRKGELDSALQNQQQSLKIREELGDKPDISNSLNRIGIIYRQKGKLDRALESYQQSLALRKELGSQRDIGASLNNIGNLYWEKGELDQAKEFFDESLALFKKLGNKQFIAMSINNIANVYEHKGDLDRALEYYQQSLALKEELGNDWETADGLFGLISVALELGSLELAQQHFTKLQQIDAQTKNRVINQLYRVARALMLKNSSRARERGKAEALLEQVVREEITKHELTVLALLSLCDLLLAELHESNDPDLLTEVRNHVARLMEIAQHQNSHTLFAETHVLQSKLALIDLDVRSARRFLTKAQLIAEERGLHRLAVKISNEHDTLLRQERHWEEIIAQEGSLSERLELVQMEDFLEGMVHKREVTLPEQPAEKPVMVQIMAKGGLSLYSKTFVPEAQIDEQLLGGFLTAISSFGSEVFGGEKIDRIMYQDHTLAMKPHEGMMFSYIFRGPSYAALQKLDRFIETVYQSSSAWKGLRRTLTTGITLDPPDEETMHSYANEIFSA